MNKNFFLALAVVMIFGACSSSTKHGTDKDAKAAVDSTQIFNLDTTALAAGTVYYHCPMTEDGVTSDKPGNCPKCGMALEPVTKQ